MELPKDRRGWLKLVGVLVLAFAAYQLVKRLLPDIDAQQVLNDVSGSLGAWTYPIVALLAFLETGRVRRAGRAGGDVRRAGGRRRRAGRDERRPDDRHRLAVGVPRRHRQLPARGQARARLGAPARRAPADHARAVRPGRELLRQARRQDDPDRALHRPRAGARALHRRQLGDAVRGDGAVLDPRDRALGDGLHAARLLRVEEHRGRHQQLRARAPRVRRHRRPGRRGDAAGPVHAGAGEPLEGRRVDGRAAGLPHGDGAGAAAAAAGSIRRRAADPGRARARADDGAGGSRRRLLRLHRLRALPRGQPGPDADRHRRARHRRGHPRRAG